MYDNAEYVMESVRAGAHGYILKDTAATELRRAIRAVQNGDAFLSPPVAGPADGGGPRRPGAGADAPATSLHSPPGSARCWTVSPTGVRTRRSPDPLGISHRTVETHRESLMRKLRIHTVAGLTRFALGAGLAGE